jgi:putative SOS response-associated peptidase YedK
MCFYYQMSTDAQTLENRYQKKIPIGTEFVSKVSINGFEHPKVVTVLKQTSHFEFFEWGLIPAWAKDSEIQKSTLNARMETLQSKPAFKYSISNRCLIPATGFYEWQWLDEKGKNKQKFLVQIENHSIFSFAGIYSQWIDKTTGEIRNTCSIITTQANAVMSKIHNTKQRMPVIIDSKDEHDWLNGVDFQHFSFPYQVELIGIPI